VSSNVELSNVVTDKVKLTELPDDKFKWVELVSVS
jgi:hypothetical protein